MTDENETEPRTDGSGTGIVPPDDETPTWLERKQRTQGLSRLTYEYFERSRREDQDLRQESSYVERDVLAFPTWPHEMIRNLSIGELLRRDDTVPRCDAPAAPRSTGGPEFDAGHHPARLVSVLVVRTAEARPAQPRTRHPRRTEADGGPYVRCRRQRRRGRLHRHRSLPQQGERTTTGRTAVLVGASVWLASRSPPPSARCPSRTCCPSRHT